MKGGTRVEWWEEGDVVGICTISVCCLSGCCSFSAWHSAQSNHFRPGGWWCQIVKEEEWRRELTTWRTDGDLRVKDMFARDLVRNIFEVVICDTYHILSFE